jgi:hypothetical protein
VQTCGRSLWQEWTEKGGADAALTLAMASAAVARRGRAGDMASCYARRGNLQAEQGAEGQLAQRETASQLQDQLAVPIKMRLAPDDVFETIAGDRLQ